jgi:uncharacterized ferritin-like protein (DUF455 family)
MHAPELRAQALEALCCADIDEKCRLVTQLWHQAGRIPLDTSAHFQAGVPLPGRPAAPRLILPGNVPQRSPFTQEGGAALIHAICHIEFNAINLALDAVWRFADMPREFYLDWLRVAAEEAYHFGLLRGHLQAMPHVIPGQRWGYGDFEAHDGLWTMCEKTAGDITARMALVPRTLEARGLDATPLIQAKLRKVGSPQSLETVAILDIILRDEVGHVAIGNHWYRWLCEQQGLDPVSHYRVLARQYSAPRLKPPFNAAARQRAGFTQAELDYLQQVV